MSKGKDKDKDDSSQYWDLDFLKEKYFLPNETFSSFIKRINIINDGIIHLLLKYAILVPSSPTLFNAGKENPNLSSCYLVDIQDNIESIFEAVKNTAIFCKKAGGVSINVTKLRSKYADIQGVQGAGYGITPWLKQFDQVALSVNQQGKRKGSIVAYIEPWHLEIEEFLQCRLDNGCVPEEFKCKALFLAVWMPDLFLKRMMENDDWTLFCPSIAKSLIGVFGCDFENAYFKLEEETEKGLLPKHLFRTMKARDLWETILNTCVKLGFPFICFKDTVNARSQEFISHANLCTEVCLPTEQDQFASCTLLSVNVSGILEKHKKYFSDYNLRDFFGLVRNKAFEYLLTARKISRSGVKQCDYNAQNALEVGFGIMGFADFCIENKLSHELNTFLDYFGDFFSSKLFRFNNAIAPNAYISKACYASPNIDWIYSKKYLEVNSRGNKEVVSKALAKLTEEEQSNIKTVWAIDPKERITFFAGVQNIVDQAISCSIYFDIEKSTYPLHELSDIYIHAWKSGLKTTYYLVLSPPALPESSCEFCSS